jgi:hypothetical protein
VSRVRSSQQSLRARVRVSRLGERRRDRALPLDVAAALPLDPEYDCSREQHHQRQSLHPFALSLATGCQGFGLVGSCARAQEIDASAVCFIAGFAVLIVALFLAARRLGRPLPGEPRGKVIPFRPRRSPYSDIASRLHGTEPAVVDAAPTPDDALVCNGCGDRLPIRESDLAPGIPPNAVKCPPCARKGA